MNSALSQQHMACSDGVKISYYSTVLRSLYFIENESL